MPYSSPLPHLKEKEPQFLILGPSIGQINVKPYWMGLQSPWPLAEAMENVSVGEHQLPEPLLPLSRVFAFIFIKPDSKALISHVLLKQKVEKY